jgi:hypothetical protein
MYFYPFLHFPLLAITEFRLPKRIRLDNQENDDLGLWIHVWYPCDPKSTLFEHSSNDVARNP